MRVNVRIHCKAPLKIKVRFGNIEHGLVKRQLLCSTSLIERIISRSRRHLLFDKATAPTKRLAYWQHSERDETHVSGPKEREKTCHVDRNQFPYSRSFVSRPMFVASEGNRAKIRDAWGPRCRVGRIV